MVHVIQYSQEGFQYHHAEKDYVMLVRWIPTDIRSTIPANASHRVGIGAFVIHNEREVTLLCCLLLRH